MRHPGTMGPPPVPVKPSTALVLRTTALSVPSSRSPSRAGSEIIDVDLRSDRSSTRSSTSTPRKRSPSTLTVKSEPSPSPEPTNKRPRTGSAESGRSARTQSRGAQGLAVTPFVPYRRSATSLSSLGLPAPRPRGQRSAGSASASEVQQVKQAPEELRSAVNRVLSKLQAIGFAEDAVSTVVPILLSRLYDRALLGGQMGEYCASSGPKLQGHLS